MYLRFSFHGLTALDIARSSTTFLGPSEYVRSKSAILVVRTSLTIVIDVSSALCLVSREYPRHGRSKSNDSFQENLKEEEHHHPGEQHEQLAAHLHRHVQEIPHVQHAGKSTPREAPENRLFTPLRCNGVFFNVREFDPSVVLVFVSLPSECRTKARETFVTIEAKKEENGLAPRTRETRIVDRSRVSFRRYVTSREQMIAVAN